jgi:hypothetical protein
VADVTKEYLNKSRDYCKKMLKKDNAKEGTYLEGYWEGRIAEIDEMMRFMDSDKYDIYS